MVIITTIIKALRQDPNYCQKPSCNLWKGYLLDRTGVNHNFRYMIDEAKPLNHTHLSVEIHLYNSCSIYSGSLVHDFYSSTLVAMAAM